MARLRLAAALLALLCLPGCYSLHAFRGQMGIVFGRQSIEELLAEGELSEERRRKLERVLDARRFAFYDLALTRSGSYLTLYETGGKAMVWNVSASAADALAPHRWSFPIVGSLPYIGFFSRELADAELARLRARGLDTLLYPVPAYSTLGWFDDPIFSPMLARSEEEIVETLIHELAHGTLWIKSNARFNENLAQFIGMEGARLYFQTRGGPEDPRLARIARRHRDSRRFNAALGELRGELARIYQASGSRAAKLAAKAASFARFKERFRREVHPTLSPGAYAWILRPETPLNNALVLQFARYHGERELFQELHRQLGGDLRATIRKLKELEDEADPRALLERWVAAGRAK